MGQSFDWSHNGSRAYRAQITPLRTGASAIASAVAVVEDITERARTIEELLVSEARLRESERMVGVGSWEMPLETLEIAYSGGFARLLNLSPGEPLHGEHFLTRVHPDDRPTVAQAIADCERTGASTCEYRLNRDDGVLRTISAHSELVPAGDGRSSYMRGTILDVTDARAAERERLEAVTLFQQGFDAAPIGMVLSDPLEWRVVRVNDAMCRLLDRSREYLLGLSVDGVTHADDQDADHRCRRGMLAGTLASAQLEKRYLRPDGEVVWVTLHIAPVRGADGTVQAFFSQVIDITEHKQREARFEQDVNDAFWLGRIRQAIDDDRLVLYSQPIVDLRSGKTVQQELLLRIRDEDGRSSRPATSCRSPNALG